jgi:hypothetical protein
VQKFSSKNAMEKERSGWSDKYMATSGALRQQRHGFVGGYHLLKAFARPSSF